MYEYLSEGVVLNAEPRGDLDARVSIFTKRYGKLVGKVKSARKITSKLAGHLQPGNVIQVRVVEAGGLQIVDALKKSSLGLDPVTLRGLHLLLNETEPDQEFWDLLTSRFSWTEALRILGWDPKEANCRVCRKTPQVFRIQDQDFYCRDCVLEARVQFKTRSRAASDLISMNDEARRRE